MNSEIKVELFETNLDGITEIQKSFIKESKDFLYFRKGEFENIIEILTEFANFLINNSDLIISSITVYFGAKELVYGIPKAKKKVGEFIKDKKEKNELTFRIIASEKAKKEHLKELKDFEKKGTGVCIISKEKSGKLRFFVNEKRFCIFFRSNNDFFGITGTDKQMIQRLRELFDREYTENKV